MARPKKTVAEAWYDLFADADIAEQVIMLQILEGIHRQARRGRNGKPAAPAAEVLTKERHFGDEAEDIANQYIPLEKEPQK